jgi:hypothetical protein
VLSGPGDVTIDTAVPRVWPVRDRSTDVPRSADWFVLDRITTGERSGTRTHGLARFGLPELMVEDVAGGRPCPRGTLPSSASRTCSWTASGRWMPTSWCWAPPCASPWPTSRPATPSRSTSPTRRCGAGPSCGLEHLASDDDPGVLRLTGTPVQDLFG